MCTMMEQSAAGHARYILYSPEGCGKSSEKQRSSTVLMLSQIFLKFREEPSLLSHA